MSLFLIESFFKLVLKLRFGGVGLEAWNVSSDAKVYTMF